MRLRAVLTAGAVAATLLTTTLPAHAAGSDITAVTVTKAKAKALAKAGVLRKADLAGFRMSASEAASEEFEAALYDCVGTTPVTYAAENPGATFERRAVTIESSAYVASTAKAAKADYRAFMTRKGDACMAKAFREAFEDEGATVDSARVRRFTVSVPGTDLVFGQRFAMAGTFNGTQFVVQGINIVGLVGPAQLAVGSTRYDGREPNLKQAQALMAKVVERVRAV